MAFRPVAAMDEAAVLGATDDLVAGIIALEDRILGYRLAPRAQGQGYATEAGHALSPRIWPQAMAPLSSGYFEGKARSANLVRRLGLAETGRDLKHCRARGTDLPHVTVKLV